MKKYFLPILLIGFWSCEEQDTTPPTVSIQSPITNQSINEIVTIVVETDDNEGINRVEFYIDDSLFFTDTESPYEYDWNTTQYDDNSEHIVKVISYDNSDNSTTSQPIVLVIDNSTSVPTGGNITSVNYTLTDMTVEWEESTDGDFKNYKLLYSEWETGNRDTLETFTDISTTSYTITEFDPSFENWFWVQVTDTLGLSSIGTGMCYFTMGTLSGTITFVGTWPDSGTVLLTLDVQYPPMGPPAGSKTIESNQLENNVYEYTLGNLSFGEYEALTVTYWPSGYSPGGDYSLIGSYIDPISMTTENPNIIIDLTATF